MTGEYYGGTLAGLLTLQQDPPRQSIGRRGRSDSPYQPSLRAPFASARGQTSEDNGKEHRSIFGERFGKSPIALGLGSAAGAKEDNAA